ncbi:hypothetical protein IF188_04235 [Microbacterium sp. NEAU-LLC]|uniref:DUF998 domain-containing protein n=1 Tax=Microbacterium helvum TaxID=2773713 RepID=A0ABR8NN24_9MICO|nr:hypothetical protein [Microbacterium helvum]MBD3940911.1 hypothetical protein [Microbacterium helvum]
MTRTTRRWIGAAAVVGGFLPLIEIPLYFATPACDVNVCGPETGALMPDWLILTRTVFSFVALISLLVFMSGVRHLVARTDSRYEWFGTVAGTVGAAWTIVDLVAKGLEGSTAIRESEWIDPTRIVPTYLLYGSITHLLLMVFGIAFGYVVLRTGMLRRWVAWTAFGVAVLQLLLVPSMFFGFNSYDFYAANGWGSVATFNGLTVLWLAFVGIAILRNKQLDES